MITTFHFTNKFEKQIQILSDGDQLLIKILLVLQWCIFAFPSISLLIGLLGILLVWIPVTLVQYICKGEEKDGEIGIK